MLSRSVAPIEHDRKLQDAATTGVGTAVDLKAWTTYVIIYIIGSAGISAGAVQLETADDPTYAGTWAALGTPVTVVASAELIVQATGVFKALRARISTNIVGGTVTVKLYSN